MKKYSQRIFCGTLAALSIGLAGLVGCKGDTQNPVKPQTQNYFEPFPMAHTAIRIPYHSDNVTMTNGDFDGDGDLDLIVGVKTKEQDGIYLITRAKLYFLENDGEGKFTLKGE